MEFYKKEKPTTAQFIEAVENMDYFTIEQLEKKRNQLRVYFSDLWNSEVLISFIHVDYSGGYPIIFAADEEEYSLMQEVYENWDDMDEEEQEYCSELFWWYAKEL